MNLNRKCYERCQGESGWTGLRCKAKAVRPYTMKKDRYGNPTGEFLDCRFCQMHQPGKVPKKRCTCKYCDYHRSKDSKIDKALIQDKLFSQTGKMIAPDVTEPSVMSSSSSVPSSSQTVSNFINSKDMEAENFCKSILTGNDSNFGERKDSRKSRMSRSKTVKSKTNASKGAVRKKKI